MTETEGSGPNGYTNFELPMNQRMTIMMTTNDEKYEHHDHLDDEQNHHDYHIDDNDHQDLSTDDSWSTSTMKSREEY